MKGELVRDTIKYLCTISSRTMCAEMNIRRVPLEEIHGISDLNVRKGDPVQNLTNLTESIADIGIQQPLLLRSIDDGYIVVAGRRRYTAAKELGLEEIPARIQDLTDDEAFKLSATENIQSESLTTPQKKRLVQNCLDRFGSLDRASDELSRSKQTLRNWEPFLTLPDEVLEMVEEEAGFFEKDARTIGKYTPPSSDGSSFEELAKEKAELMAELPKREKEQVAELIKENPSASRDELEQMLHEKETPVEINHEITGNGARALREEAENKPYQISPEELIRRQIDEFVDDL